MPLAAGLLVLGALLLMVGMALRQRPGEVGLWLMVVGLWSLALGGMTGSERHRGMFLGLVLVLAVLTAAVLLRRAGLFQLGGR